MTKKRAVNNGLERRSDPIRSKCALSGGILKSSLVFSSIPILDKKARKDFKKALTAITPLKNWYQSKMTPFSGGLYALVLDRVAWIARGDGYADEVKPQNFDAYFEICNQIGDVLEQTANGNEDCLIWHLANYGHRSQELIDRAELDDLFAKVIALDPNNLSFYATHGFVILPRWFGESMHDLEVFARQSIEKTKHVFGCGAYAMIYYGQVHVADNPFAESFCDLGLLNQGFDDLYQRFGGQISVNYHLATLEWANDVQTAKTVIDTRLTTITPDAWSNGDAAFGEEDARSTIYNFVYDDDDDDDEA